MTLAAINMDDLESKKIYAESHSEKIKKSMVKIVHEFLYVGFLLWEVREYRYYEGLGYKDVVEYAEREFCFKRSSTFNFIRLSETYSEPTKYGTPSLHLADKYRGYSQSQLTEMLSLGPSKVNEVTPNMSIREIRNLKRVEALEHEPVFVQEKFDSPVFTQTVQTSGLNERPELNAQLNSQLDLLKDQIEEHDDIIDVYSEEPEGVSYSLYRDACTRISELEESISFIESWRDDFWDVISKIQDDYESMTKKEIRDMLVDFRNGGC